MSERISRIVLAVEAIVICLPLTILFLVWGLPSLAYFAARPSRPEAIGELVAGFAVLAALLCGWRLVAAFVLRGRGVLRRLSVSWWVLPLLAALLGVGITIYNLTALVIEPSWINLFGWGLPLVVPLMHLCLERRVRTSADPAVSTDAPPGAGHRLP